MTVEEVVKVRLTNEEEEILERANDIVNKIYIETCSYDCEVEYENGIYGLLDDMQSTIKSIM